MHIILTLEEPVDIPCPPQKDMPQLDGGGVYTHSAHILTKINNPEMAGEGHTALQKRPALRMGDVHK
jgi:hypothetical protein